MHQKFPPRAVRCVFPGQRIHQQMDRTISTVELGREWGLFGGINSEKLIELHDGSAEKQIFSLIQFELTKPLG